MSVYDVQDERKGNPLDPNRLLGVADIARLLEVKPGTVTKWRKRRLFPAPDLRLSIGDAWLQGTVVEWAERTGRMP